MRTVRVAFNTQGCFWGLKEIMYVTLLAHKLEHSEYARNVRSQKKTRNGSSLLSWLLPLIMVHGIVRLRKKCLRRFGFKFKTFSSLIAASSLPQRGCCLSLGRVGSLWKRCLVWRVSAAGQTHSVSWDQLHTPGDPYFPSLLLFPPHIMRPPLCEMPWDCPHMQIKPCIVRWSKWLFWKKAFKKGTLGGGLKKETL